MKKILIIAIIATAAMFANAQYLTDNSGCLVQLYANNLKFNFFEDNTTDVSFDKGYLSQENIEVLDPGRKFVQDGICYSVNNDGKSITVTGPEKSKEDLKGDLVIPETVSFEGVTCTVTSIRFYAFKDCTGLTSVTISNSVTEIEFDAFKGCTGLTSVTLGNSVTMICSSAFAGCSGMTGKLVIPNSVTKIDSWAFRGCRGLTSLTIGNSVASIGYEAFSGCTGLTSLTWNAKNCSSIGNIPTSNINNVAIGNTVEVLPNSFVSGSKITAIIIPNSVTSIGGRAFSGCEGLTSVTFPNSVTSIGELAFYGCTGLTSVTIKNPNINVSGSAFENCDNIKKLQVPPEFEAISENLTVFPSDAGRPPTAQEINLVGGRANFNKLSKGIIQRGMKLKHIENYSDLLDEHYIEGAYVTVFKRLWTRDNTSEYEIAFKGGYDYYVIVRNGVVTSVSY